MNRVVHGFAPGKGRVARHQDGGAGQWIEPLELLDDDAAGVALVFSPDLPRGQRTRAGHWSVEIIRVSGAEGGNPAPGLGPHRRVEAVRMRHAANAGEG